MEEKEILESNKLIADFMEYIHSDSEDMDKWEMSMLDYHKNWASIMLVVEKISRIEFDRKYDESEEKWIIWTHHPVTFGMLNERGQPMVRFYCSSLFEADTLIEATYLAVVDFVKDHHNSQHKQVNP